MPTKPRALILAPETPYPMAGGGALRTASIIEYLRQRYELDVVVFRQPGAADPSAAFPPNYARRITVFDLPANRRSFTARALRNSGRILRRVPPLVDRFSGFSRELKTALSGQRYELGLIEHFWCAPYLVQLDNVCNRTVLDLHNVESQLHARCVAVDGGGTGFAHRIFRDASLALERRWLPRFELVLAASEPDATAARAIAPTARVAVYPNALPATPQPPHADEEAIVFSGNLEYHPNVQAVAFFRARIWPILRDRWPGLVWRLVGKNPLAVSRFTSGDPRIEVAGAVGDSIGELARSRVAVVPLLTGSGTRLKILEAWAAGLPVVSTAVGAEGLPVRDGQTALLADDPAAFATAVSRLLACKELRQDLGRSGRLLLEKEFTWETAWARLDF
jgi:glycosyltransferase involved in cell wall biosynthesis